MSDDVLQGRTALIVDDAAIIRIMLAKMFARHGLAIVAEAVTGQQAIDIYREHKPDVVTMDITMPGLDGISTIQKIMTIDPEARIIVVSALGQQNKIQKAIAAGARDYLIKPIREEPLMAAIRRALQGP